MSAWYSGLMTYLDPSTSPNSEGPWRKELGEMGHCIKLNIFVELSLIRVNNDRGRVIISNPVGATLHVQHQIPVRPTSYL